MIVIPAVTQRRISSGNTHDINANLKLSLTPPISAPRHAPEDR
jgi:hypothetical protein